ncbi:MAG: 1-deoxy-D-xylulose-5-phosphate reductoisomerase [Clostridia bacterium]|nr:1-deoxy-D-xylulose-5-phosphate reductoisomerase [Clostridia bacterium]
MINIALIGSTGSIGTQVLNVVDRYPNKFKIVSMAAGSSAALFEEQVNKYKPEIACLCDSEKALLIKNLPKETSFYYGNNSALHAVTEKADIVFVAVSGFAGLDVVKAAIELKKNVALANKETLVAGGEIIMALAKKNGVKIIPVDSEHSAIWQCLDFDAKKEFKKLIITASGGAFRNLTKEQLKFVTAEDALKHPNWLMGKKITIDCATMMNKGFEVIEAMWLFDTPYNKIDVLIHPQSIVHSMVEFDDGGVLAQMGVPSMEIPIQLALTYPNRLDTKLEPLNLVGKSLEFKEVDKDFYPCFALTEQAIKLGANYPCALSGADEMAVELFLNGKISYLDIAKGISYALEKTEKLGVTFESLHYTDKEARRLVLEYFNRR